MFTILYGICLLITVVVFITMAQRNYNNIDIYQWTILILIPVVIMAYWLECRVTAPESAAMLHCFIYLDSTVMLTVILFALLRTLGITVGSWVKIIAYGLAAIQLAIVCLCAPTELFYGTITIVKTPLGNAVKMTNGPLKTTHTLFLLVLLVCIVMVALLGRRRSGAYSRRNLIIYLSLPVAGLAVYGLESAFSSNFSLLPFLYTVGSLVIALRYDQAHIHDISFLIAEHHERNGTRGYLALGNHGEFLACNEKGTEFLPFLKQQRVNEPLPKDQEAAKVLWRLIQDFEREGTASARYQVEDRTIVCDLSYFSSREGGKRQGYLLALRDATEEQRAFDIVSSYNETLNAEVREKTENIKEMQRKIVLGMANMIENRDNNTGGHVKRTSDIIHILVDEIMRQGKIPLTKQFAEDVIRAAPTHDLGKITIDSNILNKPARLTDEEFAIMKTHSTKSGEMVHILLDGVEEERFVNVAFHVARYHHERWDGRGYPEGLVGTMIPLEARIMAVADVYDALVSKRVYKEPMSFEKSAAIMCECMGTQFDPNMKAVFLGARERMEQYYLQNDR